MNVIWQTTRSKTCVAHAEVLLMGCQISSILRMMILAMKSNDMNQGVLASLIASLLNDHFSAMANRKHMNSKTPDLNDHYGVECIDDEIRFEIGENGFNIKIVKD
jgi:hypothetical protein